MEQAKYDVFISYSRKDYVDEHKNVIPGNIISQIKDSFQHAGINYWFDEEGIYSGDTYMEKLADAIFASTVFVFISSVNSNASEWTAGEIGTAHLYKKKIIPFRLDDSPFARSIIVKIAHLDYIDCNPNPDKAIKDLVGSVLAAKEEEERKQRVEKERREKERMKARRAEIQQEVQNLASDLRRVGSQQQNIIDQIIAQKSLLEETDKTCPVCQKKALLGQAFCERCGFTFPLLYGLANTDTDTVHLAILQGIWKEVLSQQSRKQELDDAHNLLDLALKEVEEYAGKLKDSENSYIELSQQMSASNHKLEEQLESCKQATSNYEEQIKRNETTILELQKEIKALTQNIKKYEQEIREKEDQFQEQIKRHHTLEDKYNQLVRRTTSTKTDKEEIVERKVSVSPKAASVNASTKTHKRLKKINSLDEAFSIIETCCNTSPIQDGYDYNRAKLSLTWLKNILDKKYNLYISKSAILSCKNIGELKVLLYNSSNK